MQNDGDQAGNQPKHECWCVSWWVVGISAYLIALLTIPLAYFVLLSMEYFPAWLIESSLAIECTLFGLVGGCTYCLRAVYYNKCVRNAWDNNWIIWYFLRPIVSTVMGGITFFVLSAGLIAIGSNGATHPEYLFYILAFFAGLKVDGFLKKIESQVSKAVNMNEQKLDK